MHISQNEKHSLSVFLLELRTTSSLESMHAVLAKQFPKHSNIFDFIANLRQYECTTADNIQGLVDLDGPSPYVHEKDRLRDEKIKRLSHLLKNQTISTTEFLDEMSKDCENEFLDESDLESESMESSDTESE